LVGRGTTERKKKSEETCICPFIFQSAGLQISSKHSLGWIHTWRLSRKRLPVVQQKTLDNERKSVSFCTMRNSKCMSMMDEASVMVIPSYQSIHLTVYKQTRKPYFTPRSIHAKVTLFKPRCFGLPGPIWPSSESLQNTWPPLYPRHTHTYTSDTSLIHCLMITKRNS
jgi:hypothetical protein